jgi:CHAT domain-containing protein
MHAAWRETQGAGRRYFVDDYTVIYAPSGYALAAGLQGLAAPDRQRRSLLAVLDPTRNLIFALAEGEAIAAMFSEPTPCCLQHDQATAAAVFAASVQSNYLHFACHGSYNWRDPMQSALVLAAGDLLTLVDATMRLNLGAARLVVLSACETGLTDIRQSPDEFLGLPAGFLQAGASGVVSTLWRVDDLSTMLLMERFYRTHLQLGQTCAAALRDAQLWLRDASARQLRLAERWRYLYRTTTDSNLAAIALQRMKTWERHPEHQPFRHPYYWAAFSISGGA